jgi:hypothetical protein
MNEYSVILFHTTSSVMQTEKVLKQEGIAVKLIPTPRELSSDCGISIRFNKSDREKVEKIIEVNSIEFDSINDLN